MLKGYRTFLFGLAVAVVPSLLTYVGGFDWTSLGISPAIAGVIGVVIMALRTITNTELGTK